MTNNSNLPTTGLPAPRIVRARRLRGGLRPSEADPVAQRRRDQAVRSPRTQEGHGLDGVLRGSDEEAADAAEQGAGGGAQEELPGQQLLVKER